MLMFYDVRAQKYLESSINSNRTVVLKASKGYVVSLIFDVILLIFIRISNRHLKFKIGQFSFQMRNTLTVFKT